MYVADTNNNRIQKFDSQGGFLSKFEGLIIEKEQVNGSEAVISGEIAVDLQGNVYVIDNRNRRVHKFDNQGHFLMRWGSKGRADGLFNSLYGIAVDQQGQVYVADYDNNRILKFRLQ